MILMMIHVVIIIIEKNYQIMITILTIIMIFVVIVMIIMIVIIIYITGC